VLEELRKEIKGVDSQGGMDDCFVHHDLKAMKHLDGADKELILDMPEGVELSLICLLVVQHSTVLWTPAELKSRSQKTAVAQVEREVLANTELLNDVQEVEVILKQDFRNREQVLVINVLAQNSLR